MPTILREPGRQVSQLYLVLQVTMSDDSINNATAAAAVVVVVVVWICVVFVLSLRRKHLFGSIEKNILTGIEQFDIELFAAHLDDWRVRVCEIGMPVCPAV
jgi:hypothetical protein